MLSVEFTTDCVAGGVAVGCTWLVGVGREVSSVMVTGSANRTCCVSMVCRTGDCCVVGGVGGTAADVAVGCDVEDSAVGCSATGFAAGLAGGAGAGAPAGRRRGGAFGAAFLPEVAELMRVDITRTTCMRQH